MREFVKVISGLSAVLFAGSVSATPIHVAAGGVIELTPATAGASFASPFGAYSQAVVSHFGVPFVQSSNGNEFFTFSGSSGPSLTTIFSSAGVHTFTHGTVEVEIFNRLPGQTGTFAFQVLEATFDASIAGYDFLFQLDPLFTSAGSFTYANGSGGPSLDASFTLHETYSIDGGPAASAGFGGATAAVPEPSTWALLLTGLAALGVAGLGRRRALGAGRAP